jgi:hypothetical protein
VVEAAIRYDREDLAAVHIALDDGPLTISEVAARVHMNAPKTARCIGALCGAGFATREDPLPGAVAARYSSTSSTNTPNEKGNTR